MIIGILVPLCAGMASLSVAGGEEYRGHDDSLVATVHDAKITGSALPKMLSEFRFFADLKSLQPSENVRPYRLNAALFSDYSVKRRYAYVPDGQKPAIGDAGDVLGFPVGSALIKVFGYPNKSGFIQPIEVRVLLHRADGWLALPYIWDEAAGDARLALAGKRMEVEAVLPDGGKETISYAVPNKNQCKGCHERNGNVSPIGPKLRNLTDNGQLLAWIDWGWLPQDMALPPHMPDYSDAKASLNMRARAYLDINCAHCHNRHGPASNSGLFLTFEEDNPVALGIGKRPVAAGRGSGGRDFAIAPGDPQGSIMLYRMASTDPGIAMPELGRSLVHKEGIALLTQWVKALPDDTHSMESAN